MTWQPIETAPKSGVVFLAYHADDCWSLVYWCGQLRCWVTYRGAVPPHETPLTHWMPLPTPPGTKRETESQNNA